MLRGWGPLFVMPFTNQPATTIAWSEDFSVGVPSLDDQHKIVVSLIGRLQQAMADGRAGEKLGGLIEEIATYASYHFAWEEQLLESHAYDELPSHRAEHARLTEQVLGFRDKVADGKLTLATPVFHFLRRWLIDHICETDKRYGTYLAQRGVR